METVEEKLAKSLSAEGCTELIPFFPHLLQDLWELGSSPRDMIEMVREHIMVSHNTRVLDLACGKGAVSIRMAKELGVLVKGIDIIPEFVEYARQKSKEHKVDELCEFVVGDINQAVLKEKNYDMVILGAVGDVIGPPAQTIIALKGTVKKNGYILIDDGYAKDLANTKYTTRDQWLSIFNSVGVRLLAEKIIEDHELASLNQQQQKWIVKRAEELKEKFPEKAWLFERYIQSQQEECDELENDIDGVTMLLQIGD
ncbi:MAG: class I SAM-dependent methyltransferase [Clostridia bacterium]|nr:class I SAM-dependent methyltransferase [Clostridia bacterium]